MMGLQAIIMAGGEGTRLRPLTADLPKPLAPLLGEPVMGYALKLLKKYSIKDVGVTLWYQPKKIRAAFRQGEKYGMHLQYFEEITPLGTAGSVAMAKDQIKDTFFVLSGDGLTDCDLSKALAFHKQNHALATLVLKRVDIPLPYGVVMTDQTGRITRFIEKPGWSRVFSDLVNTGIYILEPEIFSHIPLTGAPDFGKDIFPALLAEGQPLFGFEMEGYWCDVGHQSAYLSAQQALLRGKVDLPHEIGAHPDARIDAGAVISGHCRIGRGTTIFPGATVKNCVIGENCVIGQGAKLENCCLLDRCAVREKARAEGSVLCSGAIVGVGARLSNGCALGNGAVVGSYAEIEPGVKIFPHLKVPSSTVVHENLVDQDLSAPLWSSQGAAWNAPSEICGLCGAYALVTGAKEVLVGHRDAEAAAYLAAGTLAMAGVNAASLGVATLPMLETLVPLLGMQGGIFCTGSTAVFLNEEGEMISVKQMNAMETCLLQQKLPAAAGRENKVSRMSGGEEMYLTEILPEKGGKPLFSPIAVFCDEPLLLRLAEKGLRRMNARSFRFGTLNQIRLQENETGFVLSQDGRKCSLYTPEQTPPAEKQEMLLLSLCAKESGKIFDFPNVPRAAGKIVGLSHPDGSESCRRQKKASADGLCALFLMCKALKNGMARDLLSSLPETHICTRDIACARYDKGKILHGVCDRTQLPHSLGEGVRIRHDRGYATIVPDAHRDLVRIVSESADSEFARELCDFYQREITALSGREKSSFRTP